MTNGLVTIRKGGRVVAKIVTGMDGMKAEDVVHAVRMAPWPLTAAELYAIALNRGFGSPESLVVITQTEVVEPDGNSYADFCAQNPLYSGTFQDPEFNPRWAAGFAEFTEILDLP